MTVTPLTKALLVAGATGVWLVQGDASLVRSLLVVLGAALVTLAWVVISPRRPAPSAHRPSRSTSPQRGCAPAGDAQRICADRRIERKPRGRLERDRRCNASRASMRARRSARR